MNVTCEIDDYFKGETEGQRVLLGTHTDIIQIDEFPMDFNENKVNKKEV